MVDVLHSLTETAGSMTFKEFTEITKSSLSLFCQVLLHPSLLRTGDSHSFDERSKEIPGSKGGWRWQPSKRVLFPKQKLITRTPNENDFEWVISTGRKFSTVCRRIRFDKRVCGMKRQVIASCGMGIRAGRGSGPPPPPPFPWKRERKFLLHGF